MIKNIINLGDAAVYCDFGNKIDQETNLNVIKYFKNLEELKVKGIEATVVDMHTIKPLDTNLIDKLVQECGALVTAEDHSIIGGLGGAVAEHLSTIESVPLERVGVKDRFGESGQADEMLELMGISSPYIAQAAIKSISRK